MPNSRKIKKTPASRTLAEKKVPETYDCIIVGAGAAGLACAKQLLANKLNILIIEARSRVGGRAHTVRDGNLDFPIELGAEFIHGAPAELLKLIEEAGLSFYDLTETHFETHPENGRGELREVSTFEKVAQLWEKLDGEKTPDRSVADFLKSQKISSEVRSLAESYVEGFHAADLSVIGERALATAEQSGESLQGSESFRLTGGYDQLMKSFIPDRALSARTIQFNRLAKKIEWKKGSVRLQTQSLLDGKLTDFRAKKIVVTVPLGVLKAPATSNSAVEFSPRPRSLDRALNSLHMGHAQRITFIFRSRSLWENLGSDEPITFLHTTPEHAFPTWWTMSPMRVPVLVAWQGGPKAEALSRLSDQEKANAALETLSKILNTDLDTIREELVSWHTHDWSNDPLSFGAYSYVGVDGDRESRSLSKPFDDTLYFAGEATHESAERGTVDGAIDTGLRAAKQILRAHHLGAHKNARD